MKRIILLAFVGLGALLMTNRQRWTPPAAAEPYLPEIMKAEYQHGMPQYLMARLLYQESRYRRDIITGEVKSRAGATGIAQIIPRWHPEAKPLDPVHSIHYAANYLAQLRNQFGDWETALAAYNWGPGNVNKAKRNHGDEWLATAPLETRNYVSQIWGDVA